MPDYRPLSEDEMDDFHSYVRYAFSMTDGPWSPDDAEDDEDDPELGTSYGYFDDEDLVSICRHYHWQTWVRGTTHTLAGLSAVATPPEYRRSGYARGMLRDALAEYRDDGVYLSALWPFKHPFYERLGWGTVYAGYAHSCDPADLAAFRGSSDGTWKRLEPDDWEGLNRVHDAHGAEYELTIERTEEWWHQRIFQGWTQNPFVYGYERDGEFAAYVSVVANDGDDTTLQTRDAGWVDHDAREALYGFLARHESQVDEVKLWSVDDDLLWLAENPGDIETEVHAAAMFRLVDVADAIEALPYPTDIEAEFVLEVSDPLVDWNDARFHISVADGEAIVGRTDIDEADVTLRIDELSQLYVGARDVAYFTRTGTLDTDSETAATLDALFPKSQVLLREGF